MLLSYRRTANCPTCAATIDNPNTGAGCLRYIVANPTGIVHPALCCRAAIKLTPPYRVIDFPMLPSLAAWNCINPTCHVRRRARPLPRPRSPSPNPHGSSCVRHFSESPGPPKSPHFNSPTPFSSFRPLALLRYALRPSWYDATLQINSLRRALWLPSRIQSSFPSVVPEAMVVSMQIFPAAAAEASIPTAHPMAFYRGRCPRK